MLLETYVPQPPLAEFVEVLWLYQCYDPPHARERLLPDGSLELVINLHENCMRVYDREHSFASRQASDRCAVGPLCAQSIDNDPAEPFRKIEACDPPRGAIGAFENQHFVVGQPRQRLILGRAWHFTNDAIGFPVANLKTTVSLAEFLFPVAAVGPTAACGI